MNTLEHIKFLIDNENSRTEVKCVNVPVKQLEELVQELERYREAERVVQKLP